MIDRNFARGLLVGGGVDSASPAYQPLPCREAETDLARMYVYCGRQKVFRRRPLRMHAVCIEPTSAQ